MSGGLRDAGPTGSFAFCFCNSSREHIAEFDTDMRVMRFRRAHALDRQQFKAFVLYRWGRMPPVGVGERSTQEHP